MSTSMDKSLANGKQKGFEPNLPNNSFSDRMRQSNVKSVYKADGQKRDENEASRKNANIAEKN